MANYKSGIHQTQTTEVRVKKNTPIFWAPAGGGIVGANASFYQRIVQKLENIEAVSNLTIEYVNKRDIQDAGGCKVEMFDSVKASITLTLRSDDFQNFNSLIGKPTDTYRVIKPGIYKGPYNGGAGHLVILSLNESGTQRVATLVTFCNVEVTELPGVGDQDAGFNVTLTSEDHFVGHGYNGMWCFECHWDATPSQPTGLPVGTTTPDGSTVAFGMGSGNYSYDTIPTPADLNPLKVDPDATGFYQYYAYVTVNGVHQSTGAASFATNTLTFTSSPGATGAILETCWFNDGSVEGDVDYTPTLFNSGGRDMTVGWDYYQSL